MASVPTNKHTAAKEQSGANIIQTMKLQWDLFCRVIDNFGDIGVAWRLARELAARGQTVRLWLDDASALQWMAADGVPAGIAVLAWDAVVADVGDVVIETFGCELPAGFVAQMAARPKPPRWINLEYLSAESYVERSHGLASPQHSGPGRGLTKHFFYPGFTPKTGGLLREPGLLAELADFDGDAWLRKMGIQRRPCERIVSLFAYANPLLPALLKTLASEPTLLLVCPGPAQTLAVDQPDLRTLALPYLSQPEFDRLLWASDWNFVRGEDSFVRAQWAGKPFVWQIYPQDDGAHSPKLEEFLDRYLAGTDPTLTTQTRALWRAWNGLAAWPDVLPEGKAPAFAWRAELAAQVDLASQLLGFVTASG